MSEATNGAALLEPPNSKEVQHSEAATGNLISPAPGPQPDVESVVKASKPAAAKKPKKTPEEAFLADLCALQEKAQAAKTAYIAAKREASGLKKEWDALAQEIIDKLQAWNRPVPLFDGKPEADADGATKTSDGPTAGDLSRDESWRQVKIEDLRMPHKDDPTQEGRPLPTTILQRLHDADLTTLGLLAEWTKQKMLTEIPGIGEGAAEKIASATEVFWAQRKSQRGADAALVVYVPPADATATAKPSEPSEPPASPSDGAAAAAAPYCVNCGKRFPLCESDSRWKLGFLYPLSMERLKVRKKFPIKDQSGHICGTCHFDFIEQEWKDEQAGKGA